MLRLIHLLYRDQESRVTAAGFPLVSSSFFRWVTFSPRSFAIFLSNRKPRSKSASHILQAKFDAMEKKIAALEYLMKGGNSTTASEEIRDSVLTYEGSSKQYLRGMLKDLQREKSALQEEKTALVISQTAIGSKGTLKSDSALTTMQGKRVYAILFLNLFFLCPFLYVQQLCSRF
jgi:hypothetical protein